MNHKLLHYVTFTLVIVGAINWGLVGLFDFNLVEALFSAIPILVTLIYGLIGVSAVIILATHMKDCQICGKK